MAVATSASFVQPNPGFGGTGTQAPDSALSGGQPSWLSGEGTPGAVFPFTAVAKGSIYSEVNATDDNPNLWLKVDEGGDAADWVLQGSTGVMFVRSPLIYDISAAASEQVVFQAVTASQVLEAGLHWIEATPASGSLEGDITIGTATGGGQIVAATSYPASQAAESYQALTLVDGSVAASGKIFASHDQAAGAAGTYWLQLKIRVEA